jgi:hypothetical protein
MAFGFVLIENIDSLLSTFHRVQRMSTVTLRNVQSAEYARDTFCHRVPFRACNLWLCSGRLYILGLNLVGVAGNEGVAAGASAGTSGLQKCPAARASDSL